MIKGHSFYYLLACQLIVLYVTEVTELKVVQVLAMISIPIQRLTVTIH